MRGHTAKARAGPEPGGTKTTEPSRQSKAIRNILAAEVQPKLKIGAVNDPAEVEADCVADQVMRMPEPKSADSGPPPVSGSGAEDGSGSGDSINPGGTAGGPPTIRRKCADCDDESKVRRKEAKSEASNRVHKPPVIRMKGNSGSRGEAASPEANTAINSLGVGTPLPASELSFFEPRFGRDLSNIRLHTGGIADAASKAINARAFSLGNSIAFANGEYSPGTHAGRTLMAHEITHALQGRHVIQRLVDECWIVYGAGNYKYRLNADQSIDILEGPTSHIRLQIGDNGYASIKSEIDNSVKTPCEHGPSVPESNSEPIASVQVSDTNISSSLDTTLNYSTESQYLVSDTNHLNFIDTNLNITDTMITDGHLENTDTNFNVSDTNSNFVAPPDISSKSPINIGSPESTNQQIAEPADATSTNYENEIHISHGIFQLALEGHFDGKFDVKKPHLPENLYIFKPAPNNAHSDELYMKDSNDRFQKSKTGKWVKSRNPGKKYEISTYDKEVKKNEVMGTYPNNSGVTIGLGYDFGSRTKAGSYQDLVNAGIDKTTATKLSESAGLKGIKAAKKCAELRSNISITKDHVFELLNITQQNKSYDQNFSSGEYNDVTEMVFRYLNYWKGGLGAKKIINTIKDSIGEKQGVEQLKTLSARLKTYSKDQYKTMAKIVDGVITKMNSGVDVVVDDRISDANKRSNQNFLEELSVKTKTDPPDWEVPCKKTAPLISKSVGKGGKNDSDDVKAVLNRFQELNIFFPWEDFYFDNKSKVEHQIFRYQSRISLSPDGLMSKNKKTECYLRLGKKGLSIKGNSGSKVNVSGEKRPEHSTTTEKTKHTANLTKTQIKEAIEFNNRNNFYWSYPWVGRLYEIAGDEYIGVFYATSSSKKNDEHLIKLIAAAQLKLGLNPDGQIGGGTKDAYKNWFFQKKIDEYQTQYEKDGNAETYGKKLSLFAVNSPKMVLEKFDKISYFANDNVAYHIAVSLTDGQISSLDEDLRKAMKAAMSLGNVVRSEYVQIARLSKSRTAKAELNPTIAELNPTIIKLIEKKKIIFDKNPKHKKHLLGESDKLKPVPNLLRLVIELARLASPQHIRISSVIRTTGHHGQHRAVDIGNEEIASKLLDVIATTENVKKWKIDELIFSADVAGYQNRNKWNFDLGVKHDYGVKTLDDHKDHIHFSVDK